MTQYRVHELATRCGVTADVVIEFLALSGRKVRGPSAVVGESDAAKVRHHFESGPRRARNSRSLPKVRPADQPGSQPGSEPRHEHREQPSATPAAARAPRPATTVAAPDLLNPFGAPVLPAAIAPAPAPAIGAVGRGPVVPLPAGRPTRRPVPSPHRAVPARAVATKEFDLSAPVAVDEHFPDWDRREFTREERKLWIDAGLRPDEHGLADRCRTAGILPEHLKLKLSGRLGLARLRDGESPTSVWARIQDGEHEPRRPTRLSGRFKL